MKIKSITFDCPILYRGRISFIEEIRAPELISFVNNITYNKTQSHLVVVDYNNNQYVIDVLKHSNKNDKGYSKQLPQLSNFLQATVSIIKVMLNEDSTYSFETIQSSVYKLTERSIEDEILHEFPKLSLISRHSIREYNSNIDYSKVTSWITSNHAYYVILPYKDKQYIIANYTKMSKANNLISKAELRNAFIVDVEHNSISNKDDDKSITENNLDTLM